MQLNDSSTRDEPGKQLQVLLNGSISLSETDSGDGQKCSPETRSPHACVTVNIYWHKRSGRMPTVLVLGSRMAQCPSRWVMPTRILTLHLHTFPEVQPFITQWDPGALKMWTQFRYSFIISHIISWFTRWGSAEVNAVNAILCSIAMTEHKHPLMSWLCQLIGN